MDHGQTIPAGAEAIRVLVIDNTRMHTHLLADALSRDEGLAVIRLDAGSHGLIAAVQVRPIDVLVISSNLDDEPQRGSAVLRELRASFADLRAVMLLDSSKPEDILDAFRAGAKGIFSRLDSIEMLSKCIRRVYQGQIWANSGQLTLAMEALASSPTFRAMNASGLNLLSKREFDVVQCLAEGLTNREIAERLGLSQHTVKNYLFRVFDKLGVSSRIELLFMTLSQDPNSPLLSQYFLQNAALGEGEAALAECQKAAEQGMPAAQIALAQIYLAKKKSTADLVNAYMWYSIATEQITKARNHVRDMITMEQRVEAEAEAADRLRRAGKNPSSLAEGGFKRMAGGPEGFSA